jgi:hypothetical protein
MLAYPESENVSDYVFMIMVLLFINTSNVNSLSILEKAMETPRGNGLAHMTSTPLECTECGVNLMKPTLQEGIYTTTM